MDKKDQTYTTAEICEMFGISKSTLFRWEKEDQLPHIPRDINGQREYALEHIHAISERQKKQLGRRYAHAIKVGNETSLLRISEAVAIRKFLEGDITGFMNWLNFRMYLPILCDKLCKLGWIVSNLETGPFVRLSGFFGSIPGTYVMNRIRPGITRTHRRDAQKALLDMFSSATGMPIGLYEVRDGNLEGIFSKGRWQTLNPTASLSNNFQEAKNSV